MIVIGGGTEATKRIKLLLKQECDITVISDATSKQIEVLVKKRKIKFQK